MTPIEHAPTETGGCIAAPDTADRYICYTNTQALFFSLETAAQILKVPSNRLHFVGGTVGGGFGGKVDSVHEPLAILGAMLNQRPVRSAYSRAEEMQVSSPRGAERLYIKDGVMNDGRIVARSARIYFDAGAYSRLSPYGGGQGRRPHAGSLLHSERVGGCGAASTPTELRRARCAASGSRGLTSRSRSRWTSSHAWSAWTPWSSGFSTRIGTAT